MSRPALRRALKRAGIARPARPPRPAGPRNLGVPKPPRLLLSGETSSEAFVSAATLFGRDLPLELEIGSGKARFLLAEAERNPGRLYLGLEIVEEYVLLARQKAERMGLSNVRFESVDGKAFVLGRLPEASLSGLHVFFPDPWPKARHARRRLFDAAFAAGAARALAPGSPFRAASDDPPTWALIERTLDAEPGLQRESGAPDWTSGTDYEAKWERAGKPIGKAIWRRR